jgi:hypothetical protein
VRIEEGANLYCARIYPPGRGFVAFAQALPLVVAKIVENQALGPSFLVKRRG